MSNVLPRFFSVHSVYVFAQYSLSLRCETHFVVSQQITQYKNASNTIYRLCASMQGCHSPGKPGKVREFQSGQGKVGENGKSPGKLKSVSWQKVIGRRSLATLECKKTFWRPWLCPGPHWGSLQHSPGYPSWWGLGSGLVAPFLRTPSPLLTIALNMSMNLCLPYWKKSGNLMWSGKWPRCGLQRCVTGTCCTIIHSPSCSGHFRRGYKTTPGGVWPDKDFSGNAALFPHHCGQTCFLCLYSFRCFWLFML